MDVLERMSMADGLTGLANRRRFDERVALEFALHRRTGRPLSVLMLDLDHFKQVNDQLGHAMGDEYLRRVASELKGYCRRPTDLLARYGGEEIICLLPRRRSRRRYRSRRGCVRRLPACAWPIPAPRRGK